MKPTHPIRIRRTGSRAAFTLIELLVVMGIIALLAALVLSGASIATVKSRTARVQGEREALITAIEAYKAKRGYYPPDNTNNPAASPLYYELTGTTLDNSQQYHAVNGDVLTAAQIKNAFGVGGFLNTSSDASEPVINFVKTPFKANETTTTNINGKIVTLLCQPVPPGSPTLWHYVSSNPTNNTTEFDLWMDVTWSGKTNRISNWSADPKPL